LASADSAITGLQAEVHQAQTDINDLNTFKNSASTTFVASADYNSDKNNFVTKGGIISAITASPEDKSGLVTTLSVAGVLTRADLNDA